LYLQINNGGAIEMRNNKNFSNFIFILLNIGLCICVNAEPVLPPAVVPAANNSPHTSTIVVSAQKQNMRQGQTMTVQALPSGQVINPVTFQYQRPPNSNLGKTINPPLPIVAYPTGFDIRRDTISQIGDLQLNPQQMNTIKQLQLERSRAQATPYITIAKPITRTLPINLNPGIQPPVIRLSMGMQTSIVFSDESGSPWYIDNVVLNRSLFNDQRQENQSEKSDYKGTNILTIEPLSATPYGNVSVTLKGMATPIILILTTGQNQVDVRVDAKVPGLNPDSFATSEYISMPQTDTSLSYFLDGIPPVGAKTLRAVGFPGVEAWTYQNNTYVRTYADVQFPAYMTAAKSTTGMGIYRFSGKPPSIILLSGGKAITVFIE
jgi:intracellular multiplication protein IcmK